MKELKISYSELHAIKAAIEALSKEKVDRSTTIKIVKTRLQVDKKIEEYQSVYDALTTQYTKTDEDGDVVWPTKVNEEGEKIEDTSGDPVFTDREELVNEINSLLSDTVTLNVFTISIEDLPEKIEPDVIFPLYGNIILDEQ